MSAHHTLKLFSTDSFKATEESWTQNVASTTFPAEIEQLLVWVKGHMTVVENHDSIAYGVFPPDSQVADAVCEVVISRKSHRSKWVKMLRLRLNPMLEEQIYKDNFESYKEVLGLYSASVAGVVRLKHQHEATTLKIFGRAQEQVSFLRQLAVVLEKKLAKSHLVAMEGRWLVIENK